MPPPESTPLPSTIPTLTLTPILLQAVLARLFKRGDGGDLSPEEREALARAGLGDPDAQAAMVRMFQVCSRKQDNK